MHTNLLFKLMWDWTLRSAGAGWEGFNCKAVREHHVSSVPSCGFFSPYFTQGGTFLIFRFVPEFSKRQPTHLLCYSWLRALHMPMGKFPLWGISVLALWFLSLVVHHNDFKESLALGKRVMGSNVKLPRVEKWWVLEVIVHSGLARGHLFL